MECRLWDFLQTRLNHLLSMGVVTWKLQSANYELIIFIINLKRPTMVATYNYILLRRSLDEMNHFGQIEYEKLERHYLVRYIFLCFFCVFFSIFWLLDFVSSSFCSCISRLCKIWGSLWWNCCIWWSGWLRW